MATIPQTDLVRIATANETLVSVARNLEAAANNVSDSAVTSQIRAQIDLVLDVASKISKAVAMAR